MKNEIYSRRIYRNVPEGHPDYHVVVRLTEEVNGYAIFEETYIDGEADDVPKMIAWTHGTISRSAAIEQAVDHVHRMQAVLEAKQ